MPNNLTDYEENRLLDLSWLNTDKLALMAVLGTDSTAGTEVTGGSYARQTTSSLAAASGGSKSNSGALTFLALPATDVQGWALYESAGTNRKWYGLFTPQSGSAVAATDVVTISSHGYADGDKIVFQSGYTPAGLTANTTYFVRDKTTNTFKVAATSGGSAIDITADSALTGSSWAPDVTYFRGVLVTPEPAYQLVEPLLYGAATFAFPQVCPPLEQLGVGDLKWLKPGKPVKVQRVLPDGEGVEEVVGTDYLGVIIGLDISGTTLTVPGRRRGLRPRGADGPPAAALQRHRRHRPLRLRPHQGPRPLVHPAPRPAHRHQAREVRRDVDARVRQRALRPRLDPQRHPVDDHARPAEPARRHRPRQPGGQYRMFRKDLTTIHGTVYLDDQRTVGNLRRDVAEEPNRIFVTGVTPEGMRVKNGVYPGLNQGPAAPYPFNDDRTFGAGTTDADTDTGDGVTVMINRLQVTGYLDQADNFGGYDADVTRAIRALQEEASDGPTFISGNMDPETWKALFDLDVTGASLNWAHIEPMAQDPRVRKWRHSGTGGVIGLNPRYKPDRLKVDTSVDMGTGFTRDQMREWAKAELTNSTDDNWVGTISFPTGGLVRGEHTPGETITEADVMPARELRPGMNLWAPLFDGGVLLHVSGVGVGSDGLVEAMVDTRARDALKVWQIIARNREARKNPARLWLQDHRASTTLHDSLTEWDEFGGPDPRRPRAAVDVEPDGVLRRPVHHRHRRALLLARRHPRHHADHGLHARPRRVRRQRPLPRRHPQRPRCLRRHRHRRSDRHPGTSPDPCRRGGRPLGRRGLLVQRPRPRLTRLPQHRQRRPVGHLLPAGHHPLLRRRSGDLGPRVRTHDDPGPGHHQQLPGRRLPPVRRPGDLGAPTRDPALPPRRRTRPVLRAPPLPTPQGSTPSRRLPVRGAPPCHSEERCPPGRCCPSRHPPPTSAAGTSSVTSSGSPRPRSGRRSSSARWPPVPRVCLLRRCRSGESFC
jgi:hypothetical protein